jgi:excisionase family DNA binding protein
MARGTGAQSLLSPRAIAELADVSTSTARRWIDAGLLPATRTVGKHRKVLRSDLDAFLRNHKLEPPSSQRRLLVIDDDAAFLRALPTALAHRAPDLRVDVASNATQGLILVGVKRPSVVVLDGLMEGLDGFNACRILKSLPDTQDIKILGISGDGRSEARFRKAGVDVYMQKPFTLPVLVETLRLMGLFEARPETGKTA